MRKTIALILCFALVFSAVQMVAFADEGPVTVSYAVEGSTLYVRGKVTSAGSEYLTEGQTVSISVGNAGSRNATINGEGRFSASFKDLNGEYSGITVSWDGGTLFSTGKTITVAPQVEEPAQAPPPAPSKEKEDAPPKVVVVVPPVETGNTSTTGGDTPTTGGTPTTGNDTPTTGGTIITDDGTPAPGDSTPATGDGTPTTGDGTPATGDGTPTTGDGTQTPGDGTSAPGDSTPAPGDNTPATGEGTPAPGDNTPATGDGTPTPGDNTPAPGDDTSATGDGIIIVAGDEEGADGQDGGEQTDLALLGELQQMMITAGIMPMSVGPNVTITMTDKGFIFSGTSTVPNALLTVKLMDGANVIRTLSPAIRTDASGNFSGTFPLTGISPGIYTLNIDDGTGAVTTIPSVPATIPPLIVDPISDGSPVITGMTSPYMLVTVETLINNKYERVTVLSNFRGAFYASFSKPPRWDWNVTVRVATTQAPTVYLVDKSYGVTRAKDMPTYPNDLEYGQYGPGVLAMQQRLYELGYDVDITGTFDNKTLKAVLQFQRINYLSIDGIAGAATRNLLFSVTAREYTTHFDAAGVFRYGDHGVAFLQKRLRTLKYYYGPIDDIFGRSTENAVRAFERKNKLPVDGIADNIMQALLFSDFAKIGPGSSSSSSSSSSSYYTSSPTATPLPTPDPNQLAANEIKVTSAMNFGTWDTLLERVLLRGTVRIEAESTYDLTDLNKPGMMLRATYIDSRGNQIPCRVRWQSDAGEFLSLDEIRGVLAEQGNPYTGKLGAAYWSLTPFMEAHRLSSVTAPSIGADNMLLWLGRPILNMQPGKQWRVVVEMLDTYSDTLQLDRTEVPMVLREGGVVALDENTLRAEGWSVTKVAPPATGEEDGTDTQG